MANRMILVVLAKYPPYRYSEIVRLQVYDVKPVNPLEEEIPDLKPVYEILGVVYKAQDDPLVGFVFTFQDGSTSTFRLWFQPKPTASNPLSAYEANGNRFVRAALVPLQTDKVAGIRFATEQ